MSNGMNRVTLFGRLGADPDFRVTQSGMPLLRMRVATNDAYYDKDHKLVERTDWHDVVLFGSRAEGLSRILTKGEPVFVYGSIRYSTYEKDGVTRTKAEVHARDIGLAGRAKRAANEAPHYEDTLEEPYGQPSAQAAQAAEDPAAGAPTEPDAGGAQDFPRKRRRVDTGSAMTAGA